MRFINVFLIEYFILALGIGLALWQLGALRNLAPAWIAVGALATMWTGVMLSGSSGTPTITEEIEQ